MVQRRDVFCMAHMSRREYRMKKEHGDHNADVAKNKYAQTKENYRRNFAENRSHQMQTSNLMNVNSRQDYHHVKLNFWKIFSDRPYVSVAILVIAIFLIMIKLWWGLALLAVLVAIGIYIIGRSHHPNRVLSIEFKMKASRKLSMLRALQLGGSLLMFLSTYMKQVVCVNFTSAGSTDSLQMIEGVLSSQGGSYGQQGTYFLNLLNTLTGNQLWSSYRYATNSAQMMNLPSGRWIIIWTFILMLAPAFCVLAQLFKEPYARNATLVASIISMVSFIMTPHLMKKWIVAYAMENNMTRAAATNAITIGPMAYVAIACSILVMGIALYRFIKKDNFA